MSRIGYDVLSTLTPQQQSITNTLQRNVNAGSKPVSLDPQATANYINQSVATPLLRQYDQNIMPRLKDAYAAVGGLFSSRRAFAQQQALQNLQDTIGSELGKAQLSNQQASAQNALGYNQLGLGLANSSQMAIQPYKNNQFNINGGPGNFMDLSLVGRPFYGQGGKKSGSPLSSFGSYVDGISDGSIDLGDLYGTNNNYDNYDLSQYGE